jgi:hypothetical protein
LVENAEAIYHFSYQYFKGNSVLHATHFESVLFNISVSSSDLASSCYIGALWMGALTCNANGKFLNAYLGMIKSIKKMIRIITIEDEVEEDDRFAFVKRKTKFLMWKVQLLFKLNSNSPKETTKWAASEIRKETKIFVSAVDHFLDLIDDLDDHLLYNQPYKCSSEIYLLMNHFERLNGVLFPIQMPLQNQYHPAVGRFSASLRIGNAISNHRTDFQFQPGNGSIQPVSRSVGIDDLPVEEIYKTELKKETGICGKPLSEDPESEMLSDQTLNRTEEAMVNERYSKSQAFVFDNFDVRRSKTSQRESVLSRKSLRVLDINKQASSLTRPSLPNAYTLLAKHLDSLEELNNRSKKTIQT